jgi:hypothetical protein
LKLSAGALSLVLVLVCTALAGCAPELDWRELSVPEGRFAVLLPGRALRESRTLNTPAGALTMTMYAFSLKQGTMGVAYTDYPAAAFAAEHGRKQLDAARDALLRNIAGSARSEEDISIDGFPGRQVYAEGRAGVLKARFVVAGNRLYQIAYVGAKDGVDMADVDMFLTSFRLLR